MPALYMKKGVRYQADLDIALILLFLTQQNRGEVVKHTGPIRNETKMKHYVTYKSASLVYRALNQHYYSSY